MPQECTRTGTSNLEVITIKTIELMNKAILTSALAILVSLTASSQVTVMAGSHWGAMGCYFTLDQIDSNGNVIATHNDRLFRKTSIEGMKASDDNTFRFRIHRFRSDGEVVVDKTYTVSHNVDGKLIATTERPVTQAVIVLEGGFSWMDYEMWNVDL